MAKTWTPHLLIAWGGVLGDPAADIWTNTLKCLVTDGGGASVLTEAEQQEWLGLAAPFFQAWVAYSTSTCKTHGVSVKLQFLKANMIGDDGKYIYSNTAIHDYVPVVTGQGAETNWRQSLVVTLRTTKQRGRAHVGRFYPPSTPISGYVANTPYAATAYAQEYANQAAKLIGNIDGITLTSGKTTSVCVFSPGLSDVGLEPAFTAVSGFEVDLVPDTQRRRTNRVARNVVVGTSA